jgi:gamma-glutamylcyclotransferase (GGCT)/AIG2-like uncharacterized protein YtfP
MTNKVFVYGTLKGGNQLRGMNKFANATLIDTATTSDAAYSLYDLGAFPAVVMGGNNRVQGEVWQVDEDIMQQLDYIEGYPEFYDRKQINTTSGVAWVYFIPNIQEYHNVTAIAPEPLSWN